MLKELAFTLGIEEEYLLVDRETRDLVVDPPPELFEAAKITLGDRVTPSLAPSRLATTSAVVLSAASAFAKGPVSAT